MQELGIKHSYPDQRDNLVAFKQLAQAAGLSPNRISYTGYDLADLPIMLHCGLAIAVNNANGVAKKVAHWATPNSGGKGSVREVCELILYAQQQLDDIMEYYLGLDDSLVDGASS